MAVLKELHSLFRRVTYICNYNYYCFISVAIMAFAAAQFEWYKMQKYYTELLSMAGQ